MPSLTYIDMGSHVYTSEPKSAHHGPNNLCTILAFSPVLRSITQFPKCHLLSISSRLELEGKSECRKACALAWSAGVWMWDLGSASWAEALWMRSLRPCSVASRWEGDWEDIVGDMRLRLVVWFEGWKAWDVKR